MKKIVPIKTEESREEIWRRLLTNKFESLKKREELKQEVQKQEISEKCTFKPEINKSSQNILSTM